MALFDAGTGALPAAAGCGTLGVCRPQPPAPRSLPMTAWMLALVILAGVDNQREKPEPTLSPADEKFLAGLLKEFVYDPPPEAKRVAVTIQGHGMWGNRYAIGREGWLVPGKDGKPGRVF